MSTPRLASSVYSDSFEYEGLTDELANAEDREIGTIRQLEAERDALRGEVATVRAAWAVLHQTMADTASAVDALSHIHETAQRRIVVERNKWLANCTAI